MVSKSWPMISSRKRRTRRWRSFPAMHFLVNQCVPTRLRRRPRSSPQPGPSGVSRQSPTAGSSGTPDCRPSDGRVLSTKRKDSPELEQGSPNKRSRTSTSPREKKFKTRRRTPLDGVQSRKAEPEGSSQAEEKKEERPEGGPDHSEEAASGCCSGPKQRCFSPESTSFDSNRSKSEDTEPSYHPQTLEDYIAKYKAVLKLSAGGFGQVFSGVRIEDNFPVAIKVMKKYCVRFTEVEVNGTMTRIPCEVHLLTQVGAGPGSASSTVTPLLLDWYDLGSEIILVLEKPEPCVDLLHYIIDQNPDGIVASEAKIIFRQLVEAAIEMDARGVFHRDIKPDNVLIETGADEPKARFIDFGCGTTFTPGQDFDEPQGTPLYASPEWFRYEPYTAGPTTVWQLGFLLYAMLFNKSPLITENTTRSKQAVHIPKRIGRECRDLLKGCLRMDPGERLTLEELRDHPWLNSE